MGEDTVHNQTEKMLHQFEGIVSSSSDMMALLDNRFIYLAVNSAYLNAFGKAHNEIVGHSVPEIFGEEFFKTVIKPNAERCMEGHRVRYDNWFEFPVTGRRYMDIEYSPYLDENKKILGFVVNARDITQYKQTEDRLARREHMLAERNKELNCLYRISTIAEKSELSLEDLVMEIVSTIPSAWQFPKITYARIALGDIEFKTENYCKSEWSLTSGIIVDDEKAGVLEVGYLEESSERDKGPFLSEERHLINAVAQRVGKIVQRKRALKQNVELSEEIAAHTRTEEALALSHTMLKASVESSKNMIILAVDAEYKYLFFNDVHKKGMLNSYGTDIAVGTSVLDAITDDEDRRIAKADFDEALSGKSIVKVREYGEIRRAYFENACDPIVTETGEILGVTVFSTDITERKQTEQALQSAKLLAEEYINSLPGLFYVFDEKRFVRWNSQWNVVTGYSDDELAARYGTDFFEGEDRTHIGERMMKVFHEGIADAEAEVVTKDGRRIPYYFTGQRREIDGKPYLIGMGIDITDRKQVEAERLSLERQVQQAQKLESLSVLAGGVAHDFNNLLMGVVGNAELALMSMEPESPIKIFISDIVTTAERAADLAKQMLAYSGRGRFVITRIDLQSIIDEMFHLLETSISNKVVIERDYSQNVPPVEADAAQMRQIIMNLVVNASEAIDERNGIISIRTGVMDCDRGYLDETYLDNNLPEGTYSYFEITDNGSGIDKEDITKIFDPFFTTRFTGRGLGLAAVLGIVRGHKGAIKVYSEPGKGTTFKILLPAREVLDTSSKKQHDANAKLEGKTVLLVDDEKTIRDVGGMMLKTLGLQVVTAEDGIEGLKRLKENPDKFDYIILDLTMPFMDGEETFREMRRVHKDIVVILSSGYDEQEIATRSATKGFAGFIQKPYRLAKLKEKLLSVTTE